MKAIALKFKRLIWMSLFCLALISFPLISHALNVEDVPNPQQVSGGWVTDMANILSDSTEIQLNQMISGLEAENGTEIAVVTVPETSPAASPKAFATELFNHWGIGKTDEDNGVLFLISVSDRRVEIETGYGVEPILPDAQVGNIIQNEITPRFKQGDFDGGTLAGTQALVAVLQGDSISANAGGSVQFWQHPTLLLLRMGLTAGSAITLTVVSYYLFPHRTITSETSSKESKEEEREFVWHAGVGNRILASLLDLSLLGALQTLVIFPTATLINNSTVSAINAESPLSSLLWFVPINPEGFLDLALVMGWTGFGGAWLIYRIVTEACFGCTFGKFVLGMRVVNADESSTGLQPSRIRYLIKADEPPVGWKSAAIRNLLLFIDGLIFYLVGILAINNSQKCQRIGDRPAGTVVIRRAFPERFRENLKSWSSRSGSSSSSYVGGYWGGSSGGFGGGSSGGGSSGGGGGFGGGDSGGGGAGGSW